ncbi:hypothetical protein ACP4OV_012558 [Aristida adscensionis]
MDPSARSPGPSRRQCSDTPRSFLDQERPPCPCPCVAARIYSHAAACVEAEMDDAESAAIMVNGGGGGGGGSRGNGKKRKGGGGVGVLPPPAKREPRRGLGVAELERIRVELEMAEHCYVVPALPAPAGVHLPPAPPPAAPAGVAVPHHQYVGNGAVQIEYFAPYYRAQHYHQDHYLPRFYKSNGHPYAHLKNQVDQSVVTALPILGQVASSSESSSSAYQVQLRDPRQVPQTLQLAGQTRKPNVSFVDLVESDSDDNGGDVQELDLELKL